MKISQDILNLLGRNVTGDLGHLTAYTSRRHGSVWFPKSPPLEPPTPWQVRHRDNFRLAAKAWRQLDESTRRTWHRAARLAGLYIHGYNLWVFWQVTQHQPKIRTVEAQSGQRLLATEEE